ncbi:CHAP domain-containing protein [Salinibacterium sp. PAMC 21357]|uniref:CHAP domain-containing protein n=1 Tax=Salinibacterium sp. PAMC 21357 TaxID=1112215 RepID=UPI0002881344|nr:CHAP domain-containing protein [Salinibacterium sp. PAMC 21357]
MSRSPSDSSDAAGVPAGEATSDAPVFLSRREARAAREAAEAKHVVAKAVAAPQQQVAAVVPAAVVAPAVAKSTVTPSAAVAVPEIPIAPAAVLRSDVALAHPIAKAVNVSVAAPRVFAAPKRVRRNPMRAMASMAVIGGLFAVAGLPAYGQSGFLSEEVSAVASTSVADVVPASAQSITVSADLALPEVEREHFEATSPEDLALIRQQTAIASANATYAASGARVLGDDYPWATAGYNLSPLNYYYRQCTDFVAWRLNRDAGSFSAPFRWAWSDLTPNGGNASQWKSAWDAHGWTVSATPVVGSVAWFGWDNHVAYVKAINADGTVLLEEYNYVNRVYSQRVLAATAVEAFLYPPGQ